MSRRASLEALLQLGLAAVNPRVATERWLAGAQARLSSRRLTVVAAGKAAGPMAQVLAEAWGDRIDRGLVVTRDGHDPGPDSFTRRHAGHPLPDERSAGAGEAVLELAAEMPPDGAFLLLLSGGASALLTTPADGLDLSTIRELSDALMRAGADIEELNTVRRCLTRVSGGRLADVCAAAQVEVAAISDVPGDDLATLGSGPCAPANTTAADAIAILRERLGDATPAPVSAYLGSGAVDLPTSDLARREHVRHEIVANNEDALRAIEAAAAAQGIPTWRAASALRGEARDAAGQLVDEARRHSGNGVLIAGGETTVTVRGRGRGGRNQEFALSAACRVSGDAALALLAAGTDGSDGPTDAAGAFADGGTVERGRRAGVDAEHCLAENDAYRFFAAEGGLLRTGPTGTNVMDVALVARGDVEFADESDR